MLQRTGPALSVYETGGYTIRNPYDVPGSYRRAQLHCHTTASDGYLTPEEAVAVYRSRGFEILCITDHGRRTPVAGLGGDDMLLLSGREKVVRRHYVWPLGRHLVTLGKEGNLKDAAMALQGSGIAMAAHPSWKGNLGSGAWSVQDLITYPGIALVEVRNPHSSVDEDMGRWIKAMAARGPSMPLWGTAVDDTHHADQVGRGWVEVKMESLETGAFLAALRRGSFYICCGQKAEFSAAGGTILADSAGALITCRDAAGLIRAEARESLEYTPAGDEGFVLLHCRNGQGDWAGSQPFWIFSGQRP